MKKEYHLKPDDDGKDIHEHMTLQEPTEHVELILNLPCIQLIEELQANQTWFQKRFPASGMMTSRHLLQGTTTRHKSCCKHCSQRLGRNHLRYQRPNGEDILLNFFRELASSSNPAGHVQADDHMIWHALRQAMLYRSCWLKQLQTLQPNRRCRRSQSPCTTRQACRGMQQVEHR